MVVDRGLPYLTITIGGHSYFLVGGQVTDELGKVYVQLPAELGPEMAKLSPAALAEVGF